MASRRRRLLEVERHPLGPRLYLLACRIHEWHLGVILAALYLVAVAGGAAGASSERALILPIVGVWLVAKDWRDLVPARRDSAAWQLGLHRPPPPLRALRHGDSLPALAAFVAAAVGVANLVWALGPHGSWLDDLLPQVRPLTSVPIFPSLAIPAAATLCLCAIGLLGRRQAAWALAFALLVVLGAVNLVQGLDLGEAALSLAAAGALWCGRSAFYVCRRGPLERTIRNVTALVAAAVVVTLQLVLSIVHAETSTVAREGLSLFLWQPAGPVPLSDEAGSLPLLVKLISIAMVAACAYLLFRRPIVSALPPDDDARTSARALVRAHGSDTLAFFKLRRDVRYVFTADRSAFLAYRVEAGVLLLCGDPVGSQSALPDLLRRACSLAERHGLRVAAIGVGPALLPLYQQAGLRSFYVGDEAIVETNGFSLEGRAIRKVRQSVNRLERAGYNVSLADLGALSAADLAEHERVAAVWRGGQRSRGFSMALDSLCGDDYAETLVVSARDGSGSLRAFLHFVPVYGRPAVSLSVMCRERQSPNGLTEFLVVRAIELLRERGIDDVSLNFAAFARLLHDPRGRRERLLGHVVAAANPYFQIESLYRFNAKFFPRWEPRYLVYEGRLGLFRAALAALWAEGQLPRPALPSGLADVFAARREPGPNGNGRAATA